MRRRAVKIEYQTIDGRHLPTDQAQALLAYQRRLRESNQEQRRLRPTRIAPQLSPLAQKLRKLTENVEAKLVEAVWTERCLPGGGGGGQCGVTYFQESVDRYANAVAEGGWKQRDYGAPQPRAIDQMPTVLAWLSYVSRDAADLVYAAAGSKRGDPSANISWGEVKSRLPLLKEFPSETLRDRYDEAVSDIAMRVTFG